MGASGHDRDRERRGGRNHRAWSYPGDGADGMSRRLARGIAVGVVALSMACVIASIPVGLAAREQVGPGEIVIVGDPTAPRMQETLTELQRERRQGGALEASSGQYNPGFAVLLVLLFLWLAVGLLVVWRQATELGGMDLPDHRGPVPAPHARAGARRVRRQGGAGERPARGAVGDPRRVRPLPDRAHPLAVPVVPRRAPTESPLAVGRPRPRRRYGDRDPRLPLQTRPAQQLDRGRRPLREPVRDRRARRDRRPRSSPPEP